MVSIGHNGLIGTVLLHYLWHGWLYLFPFPFSACLSCLVGCVTGICSLQFTELHLSNDLWGTHRYQILFNWGLCANSNKSFSVSRFGCLYQILFFIIHFIWRGSTGGTTLYLYCYQLPIKSYPHANAGVGGAVRFLVVGTIGKEERPHGVSSGWSSVWHCSNTGLSSTQYEQIPIILGVWPFWLTPFFFRSITFWRAYG